MLAAPSIQFGFAECYYVECSIFMLSVIRLSVIRLSVIVLSVAAPQSSQLSKVNKIKTE